MKTFLIYFLLPIFLFGCNYFGMDDDIRESFSFSAELSKEASLYKDSDHIPDSRVSELIFDPFAVNDYHLLWTESNFSLFRKNPKDSISFYNNSIVSLFLKERISTSAKKDELKYDKSYLASYIAIANTPPTGNELFFVDYNFIIPSSDDSSSFQVDLKSFPFSIYNIESNQIIFGQFRRALIAFLSDQYALDIPEGDLEVQFDYSLISRTFPYGVKITRSAIVGLDLLEGENVADKQVVFLLYLKMTFFENNNNNYDLLDEDRGEFLFEGVLNLDAEQGFNSNSVEFQYITDNIEEEELFTLLKLNNEFSSKFMKLFFNKGNTSSVLSFFIDKCYNFYYQKSNTDGKLAFGRLEKEENNSFVIDVFSNEMYVKRNYDLTTSKFSYEIYDSAHILLTESISPGTLRYHFACTKEDPLNPTLYFSYFTGNGSSLYSKPLTEFVDVFKKF